MEVQCRGPLTRIGMWQPPIRACTDDLTVTTLSVPDSRWISQGLEKFISWARMSFQTIKVKLPGVEDRERCERILRPSVRKASQKPGESFRLQTEKKVHAGRKEVPVSKMVGFGKQGAWTRWETCYNR